MADLAVGADARLLGLDEIADFRAVGHPGTRAQARKRSDAAGGSHIGILDHRVFMNDGTIGDAGVAQHAIGANPDPVAEHHIAFDDHVDVDHRVTTVTQTATQIETCRVDQRQAGEHQRARLAALVAALEHRQLLPVIDPGNLFLAGRCQRLHDHAVAGRQRDDIGQVVLALGIVVAEPPEPVAQLRGRHGHDAGVDLADGTLGAARVLVLDDCRDPPVLIAPDASITARVGKLDGQQCQRAFLGNRHQFAQGTFPHQWHIAIQNQRDAPVGESGQCLLHRVSGTELALLHHPVCVTGGKGGPDLFRAMSDHDMKILRAEQRRGIGHMLQQRASGKAVQHFRQIGHHAGALARGKNDDLEWHPGLLAVVCPGDCLRDRSLQLSRSHRRRK